MTTGSNGTSVSTTAGKIYKVYLKTIDKLDQFWYIMDSGASIMAALAGFHYIWDAPDKSINESQITVLNDAVADGADLILLAAFDPVAIDTAVEDAKSKGVKIIYVDSPANEEAIITLATDNYNAGRAAGQLMLNELSAQGITSGSIGIIGINRQHSTTVARELGFRNVLGADGRFLLLPTQYREGDPAASEEAAESYLQENSDLVGIFGTNEGSTEGIGRANSVNNNKIIAIGFDTSNEIIALFHQGSLNGVMVQNPFTMGYLGMAEAYAALHGFETGPSYIDTGVAILTK
jgi:ribose transport system substrate-binding protein